uniref:Uncharacterized protein n=1 Tax=Euplotes crassus TaxID=5936 RepID=A0A7S3KFE1_EUPCR|mmetsp:Transcript_24786/g.24575  ORF Transcript_24786/g.24575 Transcript_24786/m.24575 type:complete len:116 (+) Transcript_24786:13-360(+)
MLGRKMNFPRLNPMMYGQKRESELPPLIKHEIIYIQNSTSEIDKLCKETSDYITELKRHNAKERIKNLRKELKLIGINKSFVSSLSKKTHKRRKRHLSLTSSKKSSQDISLLAYK